jgi:hypothetical protein
MKRILIILMAVLLAVSVFGCGGNPASGDDPSVEAKPEDIPMAPPGEEEPGQSPDQDEESGWFVVEEETDAAGNVIKRSFTGEAGEVNVYEYNPEGYEVSHTEYLPDGTVTVRFTRVYHGTDPLAYTETNEAGETFDVICDENGNPEKKSFYTPDGTLIEEWFEGEMVSRRRWTSTEGNIFDEEYENDVRVKETITWANGNTEASVYENDVIVSKTYESTEEDGRYRTSSCSFVDGVLAEEIVHLSDGEVEIIRYINGLRAFYSCEKADGRKETRTYENDILVEEIILWEDGTLETKTYQDGVIVSSVHESTVDDGRHRTSSCSYVDGELVEEIIRMSDGAVDITRYTNGVKTFYSFEWSDGTYEKCTYNESGLLLYKESYVAMWNEFRTETYTVGSNGLYTYSIYQSNDGYVEEVFYDANGNKASWKSVHTDGSKHQGIFDDSGAYIEQ